MDFADGNSLVGGRSGWLPQRPRPQPGCVALMRIGIDASCWWSRRGFGRFTRELVTAMFEEPRGHEFCLFVDRPPEPEMQRPGVNVIRVNTSRPVTEAAVAEGNRSIRDVWQFTRSVAAQPLDVMFFPAVYSWFPVPPRLKTVVTVHDAIAEHFPSLIFPDIKGRLLWSLKMRLARWQANRIMTVSNAAKGEIVEYLGIDPGAIDVVSEAADPRFKPVVDHGTRQAARQRAGLPADVRIIVYVGGLAPHKNIPGLLSGLAAATDQGGIEDVHLALVGDHDGDGFHSHYQELLNLVKEDARLAGRVHFTGYVADDDLVALYSDSLAVALPSFSEGFGLPAIEAMACGVPVLASSAGSIPEVVGDAGLYFDPTRVDEIAAAIHQLATQPATLEQLEANALQRAARFTWSRAAGLALNCLEGAVLS
ncbi:MAG: glycosyltransferase family 4 protein [Gammaproteobacteria bacterium]|nr:glycosyltransferase family 4 protein [Gammaproteobacteria bacterium]